MHDADRYRLLHGPYTAPPCRLGDKLFCEVRGWVTVRRLSNGLIPWPQTIAGRSRAFILCGDLVWAVKQESALAVCQWWGITPQTVTKWRKAIGVPTFNEGTRRLWRDLTPDRLPPEVREEARRRANTPEANAKKGAAWRGKARPAHVRKILKAARKRSQTPEARQKRSATHRRLGTRPPKAGRPWTAEEDALLGTVPDEEVARRTGRTLAAVRHRRLVPDVGGFHRKRRRKKR